MNNMKTFERVEKPLKFTRQFTKEEWGFDSIQAGDIFVVTENDDHPQIRYFTFVHIGSAHIDRTPLTLLEHLKIWWKERK